ncbi:hypothetical protein [Streptomyces lydicus]|uniref:hypothetical protein n=1 Tax=Streptomyces lydicus TaxID=47763 RepID=UPI00379D5662
MPAQHWSPRPVRSPSRNTLAVFRWPGLTSRPHILDWEGWGRTPAGYDAATLFFYALYTLATAARARAEFGHILGRPEARPGLLTVCAQVLQACDRTDF